MDQSLTINGFVEHDAECESIVLPIQQWAGFPMRVLSCPRHPMFSRTEPSIGCEACRDLRRSHKSLLRLPCGSDASRDGAKQALPTLRRCFSQSWHRCRKDVGAVREKQRQDGNIAPGLKAVSVRRSHEAMLQANCWPGASQLGHVQNGCGGALH